LLALLPADLLAQPVVDGLQGAVVAPLVEVAPHRGLGREVLGQVAPLAAGPHEVEDGVEDVAHRRLAGPAPGVDRDQFLDERPLLVRQVAGVLNSSHPNDLWKHPLMGQSLRWSRFVSMGFKRMNTLSCCSNTASTPAGSSHGTSVTMTVGGWLPITQ